MSARLLLAPLFAAGLVSCSSALQNTELGRVAKDWCLVIRASQVIPVYPLTEDLQPGDIMLVRTPVADQVTEYRNKGFLPLDQHLKRLVVRDEYRQMYASNGYGVVQGVLPPRHWQAEKANGQGIPRHQWSSAPRAAFPTYRFEVTSGAGINLALPVQGVPVALSLLGASSASGSVTIADAYTYGVDDASMRPLVESWAEENVEYLRNFASAGEPKHYLRVVHRVYLAGAVDITIAADRSLGGSGTAGAARPVDLLFGREGDAAASYSAMMKAFNEKVTESLPGGTVKVAAASSRSITLVETFDRPLVIGYLAFDYPINQDGRLGVAEPTQARLEQVPIVPTTRWGPDANTQRLEGWLRIEDHRSQLSAWLVEQGYDPGMIPNYTYGEEYRELRERIVRRFSIP